VSPATRPVLATTVAGLVAAGLALQLWLAFRLNVNWDEFYFLHLVHEQARGSLDGPLQTFHVHLFGWLARLPADEIGQVTAGRIAMTACHWAMLWLAWDTARRLAGTTGATLAVLAFLAAEFALAHGPSFRADPITAFLLLLALHILLVRRLGPVQIAAAAAAGALAGVITVKAVLWLPAFAGAALWRLAETPDRRATMLRLGAVAALSLALFVLLFLWHSTRLHPAPLHSAGAAAGDAARTTLLAGVLPRAAVLAFWTPRSLPLMLLAALGLATAPRRGRASAAALALIAAPLLSVLFYRNAFPYFLPYITAPLLLVAAFGGAALAGRRAATAAVAVLCALGLAQQTLRMLPHDQRAQRAVLAAVHAAFPEPVAYIDRAGMVASFPRRGFFMSSWGVEGYLRVGAPVFAPIVEESAPPLVIANTPTLEAALRGDPSRLIATDARLLHETYIPHWGPLWIAGVDLPAGPPRRFQVRIPGRYVVEADTGLAIDSEEHAPGAVVALDRGWHVADTAAPGPATLRFHTALPRPKAPPPAGPVFWGF
jgi:hypothetical protein